MKLDEIKKIIKNGNYGVVFPKDKKNEKAAIELADLIDGSIAVASFHDEEDKESVSYGAIIKIIGIKEK